MRIDLDLVSVTRVDFMLLSGLQEEFHLEKVSKQSRSIRIKIFHATMLLPAPTTLLKRTLYHCLTNFPSRYQQAH
jgi:hypothetical protein